MAENNIEENLIEMRNNDPWELNRDDEEEDEDELDDV